MGFNDALEFALSKCNVATKTKSDYRCTLRFFKSAAEHFNIHKKAIVEIKRVHIKAMLEHVHQSRSWSNHAYNKNIGNLRAIIDRLIEWDIIEINPAGKIKTLKKMESEKYTPITKEEKQIIDYWRIATIHPIFDSAVVATINFFPTNLTMCIFRLNRIINYDGTSEPLF